MILIASAAYVDSELRSEFGQLPHAFLPVGNRRLFERQIKLLRERFLSERIYLSVPAGFALAQRDSSCLDEHGVVAVPVPAGLPLAQSVLYAINTVADYNSGLRLLHGDTLIADLPAVQDCVSVAPSHDDYAWHVVDAASPVPSVWCGYFSFAHTGDLAKCLVAANGRFDLAVAEYENLHPLQKVQARQWLDFGHVNTYFRSRASITTQRSFNQLQIVDHRVYKSGDEPRKIAAEANWFAKLPVDLKGFVPQLLRHGDEAAESYSYELEYLCLAPLNELYVHGVNPLGFWLRVFRHFTRWFDSSQAALAKTDTVFTQIQINSQRLLVDKTRQRFTTYLHVSGLDGNAPVTINGRALPSLNHVLEAAIASAEPDSVVSGVLHGDLCFSNVLFDLRADRIKLVDPRGLAWDGEFCVAGDLRYDLAKLSHSVYGFYDFVLAGAFDEDTGNGLDFKLTLHLDERVELIRDQFLDLPMLAGLTPRSVLPLVVLLFMSMLPLHADSPARQRALLANGLRLFVQMEGV